MLEIKSIYKTFAAQTSRVPGSPPTLAALDDIDLKIQEGEFFSLLGPSGCGKSTLLRILAGLEQATSGEILWKGERIDQKPARERPFNMVFQKYALFPHLSVIENVAFALSLKKVDAREIRARTDEALALVNLAGFENRRPETLSGGQQQRVALARALVNRPSCVLLDEPLGALDQKLRERMQSELRLLQKRLGLTFIFVTHDQEEAMILSDRIAVMNAGCLEQVSTPRELFENPQSLFSARFVGGRNEIAGHAVKNASTGGDKLSLALEVGGQLLRGQSVCAELQQRGAGAAAKAFIRPELLRVAKPGATPASQNSIVGRVQQILFRGHKSEVMLESNDGFIFRSLMEPEMASALRLGEMVTLEFPVSETHLFWAGE